MELREIEKRLASLPGWKYDRRRRAIAVEYRMKGFTAAVNAIVRIGRLAEKADHHPDIHLTKYRRLKIVLTTHDAGGVTRKDFDLAGKIRRAVK